MSHFHIDYSGMPGYFLARTMERGDTGYECDCEAGEVELFHDAIDAGEVDEECPCPACQHYRETRYAEWRAEQEKAGVHVE